MESRNGEAPSPLQVVTSINEASLLATAKSGEAAAVDTLYRAQAEKLFRTVHRITRNREDAEEAVQDSFLRAFLHLKSFDGRSTFSTWLTRIGINSALMILRKKRNSSEMSAHRAGVDEALWEVPDSAPIPKYGAQSESGKDFFEKQLRVCDPGFGALLSFTRSRTIRCGKRQRKSAARPTQTV
jgi:RNA polymerase sigma factor (sigma-70 family)